MESETEAKHESKALQVLQRLVTTMLMPALYRRLQLNVTDDDKYRARVEGATGSAAPGNTNNGACLMRVPKQV